MCCISLMYMYITAIAHRIPGIDLFFDTLPLPVSHYTTAATSIDDHGNGTGNGTDTNTNGVNDGDHIVFRAMAMRRDDDDDNNTHGIISNGNNGSSNGNGNGSATWAPHRVYHAPPLSLPSVTVHSTT